MHSLLPELSQPFMCRFRHAALGHSALLQVDFRERQYAVGRIPTTYTRSEGAPAQRELLAGRAVDRALRPLFDANFTFDTQACSCKQNCAQPAAPVCRSLDLAGRISGLHAASGLVNLSDPLT